MRACLEALTAELAAGRQQDGELSPASLARLVEHADLADQATRQGDLAAGVRHNRAFHRYVATLADNPAPLARTRRRTVSRQHDYRVTVRWSGDTGAGYRDYVRDHDVVVEGKPVLKGSGDPAFRGKPERWNPEELLVAASGVMREEPGNSGRFTRSCCDRR